jgi:hypothetical protein
MSDKPKISGLEIKFKAEIDAAFAGPHGFLNPENARSPSLARKSQIVGRAPRQDSAERAADGYLSRCVMIPPSEAAKAEMLGIIEVGGRSVGNQGAGMIVQAMEVSRRARQDCADAAWFLVDGDSGHTPASIYTTRTRELVGEARRRGFHAASDRHLYSGRVVPWELIDAASELLGRLEEPSSHDQYKAQRAAMERLRKALGAL